MVKSYILFHVPLFFPSQIIIVVAPVNHARHNQTSENVLFPPGTVRPTTTQPYQVYRIPALPHYDKGRRTSAEVGRKLPAQWTLP